MILLPGVLYLGVTYERTGSERYVQLINGNLTTRAPDIGDFVADLAVV
jgi:dCTP deaminase